MRKLILLLVLVAPLAIGQVEKTVSLTPPTARVNGDPLPISELARYDIQCLVAGEQVPLFSIVLNPPGTSIETPAAFDAGPIYFCRGRAVDTEGRMSDWGLSANFTVGRCEVSDCRPMPPASITVSLE